MTTRIGAKNLKSLDAYHNLFSLNMSRSHAQFSPAQLMRVHWLMLPTCVLHTHYTCSANTILLMTTANEIHIHILPHSCAFREFTSVWSQSDELSPSEHGRVRRSYQWHPMDLVRISAFKSEKKQIGGHFRQPPISEATNRVAPSLLIVSIVYTLDLVDLGWFVNDKVWVQCR